ncbi:hypothetical protein HHL21_14405 [Massilia sp. RP-1-19]|uniref:NrS-1 polymerase-like helicase domain-containing protein n=1 Tax=Massilia polaris TaxID=2728846 RepID=A0A848HLK3_9BURK|nr:DUF5906 domain-containing protein [Massilia polaris]NML62245.1 hypothetical protein [Massilia polaris]
MKTNMTAIASRLAESSKVFVRTLALLTRPAPTRMPSCCVNINALLLHLCDFDHELYGYVLKWLAYPLRHPGAKMNRALIFNGGAGSGKSLFFNRVVTGLYGGEARHVNDSVLTASFNAWAASARFVLAEDDLTNQAQVTLKRLISSDIVTINGKGVPEYAEPNRMNFVFLSGAADFLPASVGDRRFVVIEVPPARGPLFYRAVRDEIDNGGVDAFREYLMRGIDLGTFDQYTLPPVTARVRAQVEFA